MRHAMHLIEAPNCRFHSPPPAHHRPCATGRARWGKPEAQARCLCQQLCTILLESPYHCLTSLLSYSKPVQGNAIACLAQPLKSSEHAMACSNSSHMWRQSRPIGSNPNLSILWAELYSYPYCQQRRGQGDQTMYRARNQHHLETKICELVVTKTEAEQLSQEHHLLST